MKTQNIYFVVNIAVFESKLHVCCTSDAMFLKKCYEKAFKGKKDFKEFEKIINECDGLTVSNLELNPGVYFVFIDKKPLLKKFGALIHELSHVCTHLMIDHEINDDECRAYLLEYLFNEIVKKVGKQ